MYDTEWIWILLYDFYYWRVMILDGTSNNTLYDSIVSSEASVPTIHISLNTYLTENCDHCIHSDLRKMEGTIDLK